ncbi:RNA polymerase subunit sigma-70 [Pedobacter yulinensis]|uniref:RNA polymerase subunit sigma-70 n=1 Tax=Pedobacter yulinensis TaxID=2126353 RepID=A0A2T3HHB3_9SPHI|nr:RNA polymerase sigma-70 factor [Pedobacter yulinensis]PST81829.1 RNA polymerase subunit sigma-70 [Pedobacter yulinensis]
MSSTSAISDAALLGQLRLNDRKAFAAIYERYWKQLLAIAFNHTREKETAEEIVQDVFVALWNRRNEVAIRELGPYLATAIRFSVFRFLQRRKRRREIETTQVTADHYSPGEEEVFALFLKSYINDAVEELPDKCRLVFRLSRDEGLTTKEIAEKIGIAEKTVEAHLGKGLKTLRLKLKQSGLLTLLTFFN